MIPVVDIRSARGRRELTDAWEQVGFASVVGHDIDPELFAEMRDVVRRLFELSDEQQRRYRITPSNYRGHIPLGFFTPNRAEVNGVAPDRYEGWKLHWECPPEHPVAGECALYGPNRWPDELPELRIVVDRYWAACDRAVAPMFDAVAVALGIDVDLLHSWHETPLTNMTLLHYPPSPPPGDAVGIHPHKDTNVLTLLHPDRVGGLEVRSPAGAWIEVDAPADALVVNVGEMLELWSGGRFRATPHRVVNRSGLERFSFPFFVVPHHAVVVEPLVESLPGFSKASMPVGALSTEVWRTNWPGESAASFDHDLGALDR